MRKLYDGMLVSDVKELKSLRKQENMQRLSKRGRRSGSDANGYLLLRQFVASKWIRVQITIFGVKTVDRIDRQTSSRE
tara:strand:+ start:747 stop:980 length:234 start_codon:yes stop_codon:yes gene_type:complete